MNNGSEMIHNAADYLRDRLEGRKPETAIVLGSGLGKLGDRIENAVTVPYSEVPGLPVSTAAGHKGNFICGQLGGKTVLAMQGRFHYYEGYTMEQVTMGIRIMSLLGIKYLFVSNAAGGCNPSYKVGDLVIIKDHINFMPNPLIGPNKAEFGERFTDMTAPYDLNLIATAKEIGKEMRMDLKEGVYLGNTGPTYETPAEVRCYRSWGADLLGMSTIPEVIVARHCGIKVFGMSVVTNCSNTTNETAALNDGTDVVIQADRAAAAMSELFSRLVGRL